MRANTKQKKSSQNSCFFSIERSEMCGKTSDWFWKITITVYHFVISRAISRFHNYLSSSIAFPCLSVSTITFHETFSEYFDVIHSFSARWPDECALFCTCLWPIESHISTRSSRPASLESTVLSSFVLENYQQTKKERKWGYLIRFKLCCGSACQQFRLCRPKKKAFSATAIIENYI